MPILNVKVSAPASARLAEKLAATLVELTVRHLRKKAELTSVAVDFVDPEHWIVAGKSLAAWGLASFFLEIKIVDGTNTKDEKAAWQAEVFRAMGGLLGALHGESYLHVHDVRADAYGYGGLTQEQRYIESRR